MPTNLFSTYSTGETASLGKAVARRFLPRNPNTFSSILERSAGEGEGEAQNHLESQERNADIAVEPDVVLAHVGAPERQDAAEGQLGSSNVERRAARNVVEVPA